MKKSFMPPVPHYEIPENFEPINPKEFETTEAYQKHIVPFLKRQKQQKTSVRLLWFKQNWLNLLGVFIGILTLAATIILGLLQLSNG